MELKRETFLAKGFTEEEVTEILDGYHENNEKAKKLEKELLETQAKIQGFNEMKQKLDILENEKMTDAEKLEAKEKELAKREEQINKRDRESQRTLNSAKVKNILSEIGIIDEEIVNDLVTDEETSSIEKAQRYVKTFKKMQEDTIKKTKEEMQQANIKPNGSNVKSDDEATIITTKEQFDNLLKKDYSKAKEWKDNNPTLYENLK